MPQPPLEFLFGLEQFGIKFGLDNIRTLVDALGRPDRAYATAHIAGTNGKGSVTAMVDAVLRAAGHRSARYTSPHLVDVAERFVVDGRPVEPGVLERAAARIQRTVADLQAQGRLSAPPTFFEATTALALMLFRDAGVRVAVCEVGLGGRLDATNVLEPVVTAITSIGHDHQQYLGTTLAEIAAEKAGIIKQDVPVVLGAVPADAEAVIARIARERGAPVVDAASGVTVAGASDTGRHRVRIEAPPFDCGVVELGLAGRHQVGNAAVAVHVLSILHEAGFAVTSNAVREGLERVRWPGRLEIVTLADGREVLFDAAHNPEGAQALAAFLASESPGGRTLVFTAMRDKDVTDMLRALAPCVSALVLTRATTARSADPAELARVARAVGVRCPMFVEPTIAGALERAWRDTTRIVVAGSIFLLGDVMKQLGTS